MRLETTLMSNQKHGHRHFRKCLCRLHLGHWTRALKVLDRQAKPNVAPARLFEQAKAALNKETTVHGLYVALIAPKPWKSSHTRCDPTRRQTSNAGEDLQQAIENKDHFHYCGIVPFEWLPTADMKHIVVFYGFNTIEEAHAAIAKFKADNIWTAKLIPWPEMTSAGETKH